MHIEIFQLVPIEKEDSWYWHFKNKGRITADAEAFPTKAHAKRAATAVVTAVFKQALLPAPVFETQQLSAVAVVTWRKGK